MTDEELQTLIDLEAKATPGEWRQHVIEKDRVAADCGTLLEATRYSSLTRGQMADNAAFVSAARNALPKLLAEIKMHRDSMKPMTPQQAQAELDAMVDTEIAPMTDADIEKAITFCKDATTKAMARDLRLARAEVERLWAIVETLPVTADGVPVTPGSVVWFMDEGQAASGVFDRVKMRDGIQRVCFRKPYPCSPRFGRAMETTAVPIGKCFSSPVECELASAALAGSVKGEM